MFSTSDLERLITVKRREIEKEKTALGLTPAHDTNNLEHGGAKGKKQVKIAVNSKHDGSPEDKKEVKRSPEELQDIPPIPAGLERYIRRYIGLPVMLKAGEYSPNNPLIRGERAPGDVLLGLGEYERRRNTLRKLRQQQYREYLDQESIDYARQRYIGLPVMLKAGEYSPNNPLIRGERAPGDVLLGLGEYERRRNTLRKLRQQQYREYLDQRYIGLPVMLKAGEYSPNNPLIRGERAPGDVLLGLGEYERRRNTLRKLRQQQYREYLDQQAKKKQEAKEKADRERREQEEKERKWEEGKERERRQIDQDRLDAEEQRRSSVCYVPTHNVNVTQSSYKNNKVDTGVQVGISRPLSVAVQTDDAELYRLSPSPTKSQLTQAERELSPRTVVDRPDRPIQPAPWAHTRCEVERRRSYGDFDERSSTISKKSNRDKLVSDLRHTYMPSIFDADAIQMRNLQVEKEAAERRQFYQQELKNQIQEQQRIREERKSREKMLEQAEMRRLEEQLRMLRVAQEIQGDKHRDITATMKESAREFDKKRTSLQKEIDYEHQKLLRATTQPVKRNTITSHSDIVNPKLSKLPFYYPRKEKQPFSTNIPDNSIFSPNYDVDSYLRRNLNPPKDSLRSNLESVNSSYVEDKNVVVQKVQALVHESPKEKSEKRYEPSFKRKDFDIKDELPILKHSQINPVEENKEKLSKSMKLVEDKWQVPVVQKNLLKNLPNEEGKNVSILTQLGSIRRQLQLEQLKLDNMMSKDDI